MRSAFLFLFCLPFWGVLAETPPLRAEDLLNQPPDSLLPRMEKLSKTESQELISKVRELARQDYPKIDNFYFVISHLEEIQAIEKEQARLESLLWVLGLGLLLFSSLVFLLLWRLQTISKQIQYLKQT